MIASPESLSEVRDAVRDAVRIVPVGARTKPALVPADPELTHLDVRGLSGILEYDPAELTLTAQANTPVAELGAALAEHGQYLPFDPPFSAAGATLAGAVAAATSGPGAFRHGGVRDFVIGVSLVDGTGRLVHGGAKVVKNAAGFDLPKLMVGSMGRLGIMVTLSVKVLPAPARSLTLVFCAPSHEAALATMAALGRGPVQTDALDLTRDRHLRVRLGGAGEVLEARANRLRQIIAARPERLVEVTDSDAPAALLDVGGADRDGVVAAEDRLVRVALSPAQAAELIDTLAAADVPWQLSLGANLAWIAWPAARPLAELDRRLAELGLPGVRLTGSADPVSAPAAPAPTGPAGPAAPARPVGSALLGARTGGAFAERVRAALDPDHRFLEL